MSICNINAIKLTSSHKRQRSDADADARWEGGAQGSVAGVEGGAGGEYVVD